MTKLIGSLFRPLCRRLNGIKVLKVESGKTAEKENRVQTERSVEFH